MSDEGIDLRSLLEIIQREDPDLLIQMCIEANEELRKLKKEKDGPFVEISDDEFDMFKKVL